MLLLLAVALLLWWCRRPAPETLATFNIRIFPGEATDPEAVARAIAAIDADAIAVQEIRDRRRFAAVVERAGEAAGRVYAHALSPSCRGIEGLHLGVVYDAERYALIEQRPLSPDAKTCPWGQPAAALTRLGRVDGGDELALISVHLKALDSPEDHALRRAEWAWLLGARAAIEAELSAPVIVAGDFNSTGYRHPGHPERRFIDDQVAAHGLQLPTGGLACSMYWQRDGRYAVSLLDHVLAPAELDLGDAEALGMCAALDCAEQDEAPPDFHAVSDHCPVRTRLRR